MNLLSMKLYRKYIKNTEELLQRSLFGCSVGGGGTTYPERERVQNWFLLRLKIALVYKAFHALITPIQYFCSRYHLTHI